MLKRYKRNDENTKIGQMLATTKLLLLHPESNGMVQNPDDTAGNISGGLCMCSAIRTLLIEPVCYGRGRRWKVIHL